LSRLEENIEDRRKRCNESSQW